MHKTLKKNTLFALDSSKLIWCDEESQYLYKIINVQRFKNRYWFSIFTPFCKTLEMIHFHGLYHSFKIFQVWQWEDMWWTSVMMCYEDSRYLIKTTSNVRFLKKHDSARADPNPYFRACDIIVVFVLWADLVEETSETIPEEARKTVLHVLKFVLLRMPWLVWN